MLVKYWRAALLAAAVVFAANAARAGDPPATSGCSDCCKEKNCSQKCPKLNCEVFIQAKPDANCCQSGSCCASASKKGQSGKDKECCKDKCGACGCCCTPKTEQGKKTAFTHPIIIMVPMPTMTPPMCHMMAPTPIAAQPYNGVIPAPIAPPMPSQPIAMPVPPPQPAQPVYPCPTAYATSNPIAISSGSDVDFDTCLSLLGMVADVCFSHQQPASISSMCFTALGLLSDLCSQTWSGGMTLPSAAYLQHPPAYMPPPRETAILPPPIELPVSSYGGSITPAGPPTVMCSTTTPAAPAVCASKIRIKATPYDSQLEMSIGEEACMTCKKMTVKVGDCSLTMTTADGKVRVRAAELKAWADCVQTDRKDRLILKGDVSLHFKKDGQHADVTGEYIELNLATGAVTIKQTSSSVKPAAIGEAILYGSGAP